VRLECTLLLNVALPIVESDGSYLLKIKVYCIIRLT
jgi:hypothetical protein